MTRRVRADDGRLLVPATWLGREVIVMRGGPRHRWWYFEPDAQQLRAALERAGRRLPYRPTNVLEQHPDYQTVGAVWRWTGQEETA